MAAADVGLWRSYFQGELSFAELYGPCGTGYQRFSQLRPDSRTVLSTPDRKSRWKLWDLATGEELRTFAGHPSVSEERCNSDGWSNRALG